GVLSTGVREPGRRRLRVESRAMPKPRSVYACTECGARAPRWLGRCPECGAWSSLIEEPVASAAPARALLRDAPGGGPGGLREVGPGASARLATGIVELDRVLGGGLVPGSVVLLGGEPGVGKSTLALQLAARLCERGARVLYVSGEESPEQIRLRAERLSGGLDPAAAAGTARDSHHAPRRPGADT